MNLRLPLLALALLLPAAAQAQADTHAGTFDLIVSGVKIGKSTYKVEKTKAGYKLTNRATYRVAGTDGDQSDDFKFNDSFGYIDGTTTDHNTQLQTGYVPNKTRDQATITHFQGAAHDSSVIDIKPDLIVLPPLDAGAAEVALLLATTHPTPGNKYSLLIPGGAGAGSGGGGGRRGGGAPSANTTADASALPPGDNDLDATWIKGKDTSGTLDGKLLLLHAYLFSAGGLRIILYADTDNNLMQLNAAAFHASYTRQNFKLNLGPAAQSTTPASTP